MRVFVIIVIVVVFGFFGYEYVVKGCNLVEVIGVLVG